MALTALYSAASGAKAQQTNIDVISNNLANMNTTGFKKMRANFQDLLYQQLQGAGAIDSASNQIPSETTIGLGVALVNTQRDFSQGRLETTNRKLDVAIAGKGFFLVNLPEDVGRSGYGFTRDGNFYIDAVGELVTSHGYKIQPGLAFTEGSTDISISEDGTVSELPPGDIARRNVGRLDLAYFMNEEGLEAIGGNILLETDASGTANVSNPGVGGLGVLKQGFLESSNVELVDELVQMISTQRAFEFNLQSMQTADDMLQALAMLRR